MLFHQNIFRITTDYPPKHIQDYYWLSTKTFPELLLLFYQYICRITNAHHQIYPGLLMLFHQNIFRITTSYPPKHIQNYYCFSTKTYSGLQLTIHQNISRITTDYPPKHFQNYCCLSTLSDNIYTAKDSKDFAKTTQIFQGLCKFTRSLLSNLLQ